MAKVLVFGAGPLGSLFAAKLKESGHEISILARGHRLSDIREHGIVLFDEMTKQQTITSIAAVDIKHLTRTRDLIVLAVRTIRAGKRIDPGWQQDNPIALGRLTILDHWLSNSDWHHLLAGNIIRFIGNLLAETKKDIA